MYDFTVFVVAPISLAAFIVFSVIFVSEFLRKS